MMKTLFVPCILCADGAGQVKMGLEAKFAVCHLRGKRCPGLCGRVAGQKLGLGEGVLAQGRGWNRLAFKAFSNPNPSGTP